MNRDYLKQIMIDQKETYLNNPMIKRDYPLEDNVNLELEELENPI